MVVVDRIELANRARSSAWNRPAIASSPGMVQRSFSGGSAISVIPAMNVAPRSVSTPTEPPSRSVNVDLRVNARLLRQTGDDGAQTAPGEPEDGHGRVFHLDVGMVQVGPVAADLDDLSSMSQSKRSSMCGDWLTSTPPPSVSHLPRQGSD